MILFAYFVKYGGIYCKCRIIVDQWQFKFNHDRVANREYACNLKNRIIFFLTIYIKIRTNGQLSFLTIPCIFFNLIIFHANIRKEIQTEQNAHHNNVMSDDKNFGAFFVRHNIEYEVTDCKIIVSFIFEAVFLNIFIANSMFNICGSIF